MTSAPTPAPTRQSALESALEGLFIKQVRLAGGLAVKVAPINKGMPDRLVLFPGGRIYLVELKTVQGRRSAAQELWHARALQLGTRVVTLQGPEHVRSWVRGVVSTAAGDTKKRRATPAEMKRRALAIEEELAKLSPDHEASLLPQEQPRKPSSGPRLPDASSSAPAPLDETSTS